MLTTAWANHVRAVKNHDQEQLRICKAYVRWKWRQRILTILKVWRHQALYGRIDGLYSRQMLLKTLAEQKFASNLLEKHMADQVLELEECRTIVAKEIGECTLRCVLVGVYCVYTARCVLRWCIAWIFLSIARYNRPGLFFSNL
jgi:hypothetical protein